MRSSRYTSVLWACAALLVVTDLGAAAVPATIRAQIVETTPGKSFSIQVTIPTGLEVSATKPAYIVLSTDRKDKPTIPVKIRPAVPLTGTQPAAR